MFQILILFWETLIKVCFLFSYRNLSSMSSKCSYMTSFAANIKIIYLALIKNRGTVGCFLEHQLTSLLLKIKIKFNINF